MPYECGELEVVVNITLFIALQLISKLHKFVLTPGVGQPSNCWLAPGIKFPRGDSSVLETLWRAKPRKVPLRVTIHA